MTPPTWIRDALGRIVPWVTFSAEYGYPEALAALKSGEVVEVESPWADRPELDVEAARQALARAIR